MFYKLEIYVPTTHADVVRNAIAAAGAGRLGQYDNCIWQCEGTGHFRPLPGSHPFFGSENQIEAVPETKLETMCAAEDLSGVIQAMRVNHPYETPAFYFWPVELKELS